MMSKHLYIMVDLHYMMGKHLYIMVDLHYITTDNHVVLFIYKRINDRATHTTMRTQLRLDIRVFSYSVSSTDG